MKHSTLVASVVILVTSICCQQPVDKQLVPGPFGSRLDKAKLSNENTRHYDPGQAAPCAYEEVVLEQIEEAVPYSISLQTGYDFKNNVLNSSNKGQTYITYYYKLSRYAYDHWLIVNDPLYYAELLAKGLEVANSITNGSGNQIVIDNQTYDLVKGRINNLLQNCDGPQIISILNQLSADLDANKNKTKNQILNFLN